MILLLININNNQSEYETQTRGIPLIPHTVKVLFIHMPYMKISSQNPPGNKIKIILLL